MMASWQQFLQPFNLNETPTIHGNVVADLSTYLGLIKVSGADAAAFLQGQFTNDVHQVTPTQSQLSAWCTPKGRILVNFRLFLREDSYYLLLPQASIEATLKRLRLYVLRAQVTLEVVPLIAIGLAGEQSAELLTSCVDIPLPATADASITERPFTVLQLAGRYLIVAEAQPLHTLWSCLAAQATPVTAASWQLLDILAGMPQIVPETADTFAPQMLNWQLLGGVNFKKGCYSGQEIVARLHYLGNLKQRLYLAQMDSTVLPAAGTALYVNDSEHSVGQIMNAQIHPDGGIRLLAVLNIQTVARQAPIVDPQGISLHILPLPYVVDS
ncbi:MAG: folate-binding protein [Pseudomonadota bacterium]|nr:folate-binding protein [Pseudomonadota bacterium]